MKKITYGTGIITRYDYDSDGNISHLQTVGLDESGKEKQVFQDYSYQYDGNGNRTAKEGLVWAGSDNTRQESIQFIYDRKNQLVEETYGNQKKRYDYDPAGNRIWQEKDGESFVFTYNQKNQLTAKRGETGSYVYLYDKQGSLTEELCGGQKTTYHYDSLNRQTEIIKADGMFQRNRYDAEGLRAEMEENGRLCQFIFHKGEIVNEERIEEQPPIRYIRGYGAEYLEQDGRSYSIHKDEQSSTVFLLDRNHEIESSYSYDGFGGFQGQSDGQVKNRILYTGQQYDSLNSQYYLRARFYDPVLGRFTQEDTYRGDGLNLYDYCQNNPVTYYDPSGYCTETKFAQSKDGMGELSEGLIHLPNGKVDVDGLPGTAGLQVYRRLSPEEMIFLTKQYGVEFELTYILGPGKNGAGGQYWLYSGIENKVWSPIGDNVISIYHTHPKGSIGASGGDRKFMNDLIEAGSPQRSSQIIPVGGTEIGRFNTKGTYISYPIKHDN